MKLLIIIGSGAVGKMTVGQELMKITDLRLFHNHMAIEPVIEIFGNRNGEAVNKIRKVIFEEFAKSDNYGMIFTYMWAFDYQSDWDYIESVKEIFKPYDTEFYCVELFASQEIRLHRNVTENRQKNKKSKQDAKFAEQLILNEDAKARLISNEGEVPFVNYMKIDNSNLSASDVAKIVKDKFNL